MTDARYFRPMNWQCGQGEPWPATQIILEACEFATKAHGDQKRKYTDEPYMVHCLEVARWVAAVTDDPMMIAAALLHDTVEDTSVTLADVARDFGPRVRSLVFWLTDISTPEDGNRVERKRIDREHSARATPDAQTIKLADLCSNTASISQHDPSFAKVYLREKGLLLPLLYQGDPRLRQWAEHALEIGLRRIGEIA